ncbi:Phosphofurin Acidic Cluster Sorting Protein 1 [Manis pentadactyla]|nr:Phosphofurin Acidic Cluster Sorting Protein 1 [Manis pentadactyla]
MKGQIFIENHWLVLRPQGMTEYRMEGTRTSTLDCSVFQFIKIRRRVPAGDTHITGLSKEKFKKCPTDGIKRMQKG